jgi:hypothetical protein
MKQFAVHAKRTYEVISENGVFSFVIWHMSRMSPSGVQMDVHQKDYATYWVADAAARETMQANGWNC